METPKFLWAACSSISLPYGGKLLWCVGWVFGFFFMFKRNFMCFRFCPLVLIPLVSCHHRKEYGLFFSTSPDNHQVFISTDTIFSYLPSCGPKSFLESISSLLRAPVWLLPFWTDLFPFSNVH